MSHVNPYYMYDNEAPPKYEEIDLNEIPVRDIRPPIVNNQPVYTTQMTDRSVPNGRFFDYRKESALIQCQFCNTTIRTEIDKQPHGCAYLSCTCLVCIGCFLGCCLIPFCLPECNATKHYCPNCKKQVGCYN